MAKSPNRTRKIFGSSITIAFLPLLFFIPLIIYMTLKSGIYHASDFRQNVLIETFGMLFEVSLIVILAAGIIERGIKEMQIKRYADEIDDFRFWQSEMSSRRIQGNIMRLNRMGVYNINLNNCYLVRSNLGRARLVGSNLRAVNLENASLVISHLEKANLAGANLKGANLVGVHLDRANLNYCHLDNARLDEACLNGASLKGAHLKGVSFQEADLRGVKGLTYVQLADVKTMYKAQLDKAVLEMVKKRYPHLASLPTS